MGQVVDRKRLLLILKRLDDPSSEENWGAIRELKRLDVDLPQVLFEHYKESRSWRARVSCVFFAIHDARENNIAVQLGIMALNDRSRVVRHRACSLLAYSLRDDALPYLRNLLMHHDTSTREDAQAAIDAIEHRNHNWFVDRDHTGRLMWTVEKEGVSSAGR